MPTIGDHAQRRGEAPCVLKGIPKRHLCVAGAVEEENRTANERKVDPRIGSNKRVTGSAHIRVQPRAGEEPFCSERLERGRICHTDEAEGDSFEQPVPCDQPASARNALSRLDERHERERLLAAPRPRGDARTAGEDEAAHPMWMTPRQSERDDASERMPDDHRRGAEQRGDAVGVGIERLRRRR
jgi:hypothetical protein